ncbi:hypothetical protein HMPREF0043_01582 [Actinobaculum sp. oral taxon 183 str. F0552]|nr:hypothetical protein HMPREF0043_01582 [Actinobaculum sp. oral taxon 183 str. F0552]
MQAIVDGATLISLRPRRGDAARYAASPPARPAIRPVGACE